MKTIILTLVTFVLLVSCTEDNPQPVAPDPFVGTWVLVNDVSPDVELSFDIIDGSEGLVVQNVQFKHPEVTGALDYTTELYYRYAVNAACKRITITGNNEQETVIITMLNNAIPLKTPDQMRVYIIDIDIKDGPFIELNNQIFTRAN